MIRWWPLLSACVLVAGGACQRKLVPPPVPVPVVGELRAKFERVVPGSLPVPNDAALLLAARKAADAVAGRLRVRTPAPPETPSLRLTVEIELGWQAQTRELRSVLHARLQPLGDIPGVARIDREALVEKEGIASSPSAEQLAAHVEHALELVLGGLMRAEQLWLGPAADARAALAGSDDELRDEAVRIVGERHDREAVPALISILKTEDEALRDRAIGALAEIGDPRAARPLTALAKFGDLTELPKILDAISRVGGPEAQSYLELVVGGHPSPEIRALAQRALEHMREKPDAAAR